MRLSRCVRATPCEAATAVAEASKPHSDTRVAVAVAVAVAAMAPAAAGTRPVSANAVGDDEHNTSAPSTLWPLPPPLPMAADVGAEGDDGARAIMGRANALRTGTSACATAVAASERTGGSNS